MSDRDYSQTRHGSRNASHATGLAPSALSEEKREPSNEALIMLGQVFLLPEMGGIQDRQALKPLRGNGVTSTPIGACSTKYRDARTLWLLPA
jgi:hypothetical protein